MNTSAVDSLEHSPDYLPAATVIAPEVSVVVPCLNEARTLRTCVEKIQRTFQQHAIQGEIVVADNGSTDGSQDIARAMGARLVHVEQKGYGNAIMGGVAAAHGRYIVMGDGDDTYNFCDIPLFSGETSSGA